MHSQNRRNLVRVLLCWLSLSDQVGDKVTKVKVGDAVGLGVFMEACLDCEMCTTGDENYCLNGITKTYGDTKKYG